MEETEIQNQRPVLMKTGTVILDNNVANSNQSIQKQKSAILTRYPSNLIKLGRKEIFLQSDGTGVNDWLQKFLPYEILLFIFTMLPKNDFKNVARVCKHFRAVTQDSMFGWISVFKYSFDCQNCNKDVLSSSSMLIL